MFEMFALMINVLILTISDTMVTCYLFSFYLHVWSSLTQRITHHHLLHYIFKNLPWEFPARICRSYFPQEFAAGFCGGNLPQEFAVAICRRNLPWNFPPGICRNLPCLFAVKIFRRNLPWLFAVGFLYL